jgi:Ni2+-binding GTPase involved in maturation of urease and hydrogenase
VVGADALPETGAVRDLLGGADYAIVTKVDVAGTGQRVADARARWRGAFPALRVFACSAETGEGLDDWCTLLEARVGDAVIA